MALSSIHPGALPRLFRRSRVLIIGCGDIGQRLVGLSHNAAVKAMALSASPAKYPLLKSHGLVVLAGNLDHPEALHRLAGIAHRVVHLAPPHNSGWEDLRTKHLLQILRKRSPPRQLVYASTTGVYGDRHGALTSETSPITPLTPRAIRRANAEHMVMNFGRSVACNSITLRIPGIYSPTRSGEQVRERLTKQTPVLIREDDVFTNHIHADDLARACWLALWKGKTQRAINVCDDTKLLMGDYYDLLADAHDLPRPPRVSRSNAPQTMPLNLLSFMGESRRITNTRLTTELGLKLRYPTVKEGWAIAGLKNSRVIDATVP